MKSAAYVMFEHRPYARQFVLDQSRYVLQEDSGIPLRYFDPSVWALQFYGAYSKPYRFSNMTTRRTLPGYTKSAGTSTLPFGIGYHFQVDTANLLFAIRK